MRSLLVGGTKAEPSLTILDTPKPQPGSGEVLIRVAAAGLMPTELGWEPTWFSKSGEPRSNAIPSHEFSGTIEMLGPAVTGVSVGDEVFGMNDWFQDGSMAEYCLARVEDVALKPHTLTHAEAASVPISALTACQALFDHGTLQKNERVLIQGSGSVGIFAVQLAKHHGAYVIATASGGNIDFIRYLGADQVIDHRSAKFEDATGKVNLVFDSVGGETLRRSWSVLGLNGRLVTIASSSEAPPDERTEKAFFIVKPSREQLTSIASLLDEGILQTFVKSVVTLPEAALEYVAPSKTGRGKTVVEI